VSFAKATLSGTLIADPEKRFTPNDHVVTTLTVSVENPGFSKAGPQEPFLLKVVCWRNLAEAVAERLCSGDCILVEGKLMLNSYQTQDGIQKKAFELEASTVEKLNGLPENLGPSASGGAMASNGVPQPAAAPQAARMPAPVAAAPASKPASGGGFFSSEDLLTENDIPF